MQRKDFGNVQLSWGTTYALNAAPRPEREASHACWVGLFYTR
jgi:hypothetical protein